MPGRPPVLGSFPGGRERAGKKSYAALKTYLQENPGWVGKNWGKLQKNADSKKALGELGYYVRSRGKRHVLRYGGQDVWSWGSRPSGGAPYDPIPKGKKPGEFVSPSKPKPASKGPSISGPASTASGSRSGSSSSGQSGMSLGLQGGAWQQQLLNLLAQAQKLKVAQPTLTPNMLDKYLKDYDPLKRAEREASLAYDDSINTIRGELSGLDAGMPGIMSDLDKWYGQVGEFNQQAAAANQARLGAATGEMQDATTAIIAAMGGAANPASGGAGEEGIISQGSLQGMGAAQGNFDSNLGQFFQMAGASRKAQIASQMRRERAGLAQQLASAQREKGLSSSRSLSEFEDNRAEMIMQLQQALYEQRKASTDSQFDRILGLANLSGMASTIGSESDAAAITNARGIEDWKNQIILNEQERLRLQQFRGLQAGGEQYPFAQLEPGTRAQLAGQLMTNLLGPKGYLTVNPKQFLNTARQRLYQVAGYQRTPQTEAFIQSLLEPRLVNWWNKYHPKQKYTG